MEEAHGTKEESSEPEERKRAPKTKTFSRFVLPSNRNPFSIHFEVLRRFVTASRGGAEGVPADRVEGETVPVQAGSMNVRFLRDVGLLTVTERGRYIPTPEAVRFVNARSVSDEKAKPILNALLASTWFAEVAKTAFSTQPIMTEDQLLGELALAAQTDKEREGTALRVILEYLVYSGIVTRDERGLSMGSSRTESGQAEQLPTTRPDVKSGAPEKAAETPGWHVIQTEDFYVKIRSDLASVDDLADHLEILKKKIDRLRAASRAAPELIASGSK